jgi:hypothetical protein
VYVSEEDLVEPRLDIYHLHSMTGMPVRTESCDGADNLTRVEIREGLELFVSPTYLPRAAAKVDDLTRALDEILEIDDGT